MTQSRNGHEPLLELIFSTWCRNKRRVFRRAEPRTQRSGVSGAPSGNGRWAAYFASLRARLGDRSASAAVVISENTSLDFALAKAQEKKLVLPDFQRDFVWKPSDVVKLLTSLFNGYPIGGLLFMENTEGYGSRGLDGVPEEPTSALQPVADGVVLILDGQQRLTSCYRAFCGAMVEDRYDYPGRYYFNYGKYVDYIQPEKLSGSEVEEFLEYVSAKKVTKDLPT